MKTTIYETFLEIYQSDDKVATIAKYAHDTVFKFYVTRVLYSKDFVFDDSLLSELPSSVQPNKWVPDDLADNFLRAAWRQIYIFDKSQAIDPVIRNKRWNEFLIGLHYNEAKFIMDVRTGQFYQDFKDIHQSFQDVFGDLDIPDVGMVEQSSFVSTMPETFNPPTENDLESVGMQPDTGLVIVGQGGGNEVDSGEQVTVEIAPEPKKRGRKKKEASNE